MTLDQGLLFGLVGLILGFLLWGRFRHDLVAAGGLFAAVVLGLVSQEDAFSGFSNHAVIIVALVLVASRAIENSGALSLLAALIAGKGRAVHAHITVFGGVGASLSALINNVAALAILMPLDMQAAKSEKRPPGKTLMPLAFATILGGMITLIGTPSNIVASSIRAEQLGAPYAMFDFTPVGIVAALTGLAFIALIGWRFVPDREDKAAALASDTAFEAELTVGEDSKFNGKVAAETFEDARSADVQVLRVIRDGQRFGRQRLWGLKLVPGDVLIVRGATDGIASFIKAGGLQQPDAEDEKVVLRTPTGKSGEKEGKDESTEEHEPSVFEVVVRSESRLVGRSAKSLGLRRWYDLTLLGISRNRRVARDKVQNEKIEAGDVLLLSSGGTDTMNMLAQLDLIAVESFSVAPVKIRRALIALGLFVAAVAVATAGLLSFTISIAIAVAAYGALGYVPARDFYANIDWSVVVMLACLLPVGAALESVGGTALIAGAIADWTQGGSPVIALIAIMVVTMTLSDALNNIATMVITGPIAIDLAQRLQVNPDTFLMGVAVAAACAFLTPIGHKNNTLIMSPGGFHFSDYWRMGLPLEIVVLTVSIPMLLWVWPL